VWGVWNLCRTSGGIEGFMNSLDIEAVTRVLSAIGDDPQREGLLKTPERVIKSWDKLYGGYREDPAEVLQTVFVEGSCDEMVILKDIEFYSTCEHHMLPFFGRCHIGYIPAGRVVGISKLARLLEVYARRLQIQERLTTQIAESLIEHLTPKGVMVIMEAQHFCMTARGVEKQDSIMVTSAMRGVFTLPEVRSEFMSLVKR
jgi:GTP cyclohydrolase I